MDNRIGFQQAVSKHRTLFITQEMITPPENDISCSNCEACCCRLEVLLISDTGVPRRLIEIDKWGGMTMARLADGWCAALDRNSMKCTIYDRRPLVCRDFEMGSHACIIERTDNQGFIDSE